MGIKFIGPGDCLNIGCPFWNKQSDKNCYITQTINATWMQKYCNNQPIPKKQNRREVKNSGKNTESNPKENA